MPKATVEWSDVETWKRLVTSIVATGIKIDLHETAKHFGTTFSTLENRFRQIKKDAAAMQGDDKGVKAGAAEETPKRSKAAPDTPRSKTPKKDALHTVANGRVSKSVPGKKSGIKQEPVDSDCDSEQVVMEGMDSPA